MTFEMDNSRNHLTAFGKHTICENKNFNSDSYIIRLPLPMYLLQLRRHMFNYSYNGVITQVHRTFAIMQITTPLVLISTYSQAISVICSTVCCAKRRHHLYPSTRPAALMAWTSCEKRKNKKIHHNVLWNKTGKLHVEFNVHLYLLIIMHLYFTN